MADVVGAISQIAARARKFRDRGLGEQNTKASLIEPVLEVLGWDTRDPDEVHREFRPTGKDSPVDYALKLMRKPRLFVEAKGLGESLADRKWVTQVLSYATIAGVEWCVLSDGDEFRFYNASAPVDAEDKMFCSVRITSQEPTEAVRALSLISRINLQDNLLESLWMSHFVDRRVKTALHEMLASPNKTLVGLLRQRAPKLSTKEIADSIRRLDIKIESAVVLPELRSRSRTVKKPTPPGSRPKVVKRTPVHDASLTDLIRGGVLKPPLRLFVNYLNRKLEACVEKDGSVTFQGASFNSCSSAAATARGSVTGRPMATNGWDFWRFMDADGSSAQLSVLRRRLAGKEGKVSSPALRIAEEGESRRLA